MDSEFPPALAISFEQLYPVFEPYPIWRDLPKIVSSSRFSPVPIIIWNNDRCRRRRREHIEHPDTRHARSLRPRLAPGVRQHIYCSVTDHSYSRIRRKPQSAVNGRPVEDANLPVDG